MRSPYVATALGSGFRAVAGEGWLVTLGMAVALLRGVLALPAAAFATSVTWLSVRATLAGGGGPDAVLPGVLRAWASPRAWATFGGLWLAGLLLWGAVRVLWLAGAAPLLAWRLGGGRGEEPRFTEGAAWRFHRVLPVAVGAFLLDLAARAGIVAAVAGALVLGSRIHGTSASGAAAFVAALGMVAAIVLAVTLSGLGELAVAGAALAGDGPAEAAARALRTFGHRPAAVLSVVLAVVAGTALAAGAMQAALGTLASLARAGPPALLAFPEGAAAVLVALLAAGTELWRLSALGVLALAPQPGREKRWMTLRSESLGMRPPSQ